MLNILPNSNTSMLSLLGVVYVPNFYFVSSSLTFAVMTLHQHLIDVRRTMQVVLKQEDTVGTTDSDFIDGSGGADDDLMM